ncbi:MAG: pantetheine-phosphate adenylyltransferase [Clostridia bacterium]|nr:pantetheine-phosphate adenylyltransferase [Clostridia bacterium]
MECIYPGSFDPVTFGHLDIITRLDGLFDRVVVGVLHNPEKQGFFTPEERIDMLRECCSGLRHVELVLWGGLLVDMAKEMQIRTIVRGFRSTGDMESEVAMLRVNRMLYPALETLLMPTSPETEGISSSVVRQVAAFGGDLSSLVPPSVDQRVRQKISQRKINTAK